MRQLDPYWSPATVNPHTTSEVPPASGETLQGWMDEQGQPKEAHRQWKAADRLGDWPPGGRQIRAGHNTRPLGSHGSVGKMKGSGRWHRKVGRPTPPSAEGGEPWRKAISETQ